ncbi:MAG: VOC family protein [Bryobacteraceae bacterium]
MSVREVVPFLRVSDMERSLRFYMDGLGFTMPLKWEVDNKVRWCRLEKDTAAIMLQQFATDGHDSWRPESKVGIGVSIVFICEDALEIYRQALACGLKPSEPQVGNAMWVTSLTDPDGYNIDFESFTDTPEDTRLSEIGDSR